jgi:hypothetical protein
MVTSGTTVNRQAAEKAYQKMVNAATAATRAIATCRSDAMIMED